MFEIFFLLECVWLSMCLCHCYILYVQAYKNEQGPSRHINKKNKMYAGHNNNNNTQTFLNNVRLWKLGSNPKDDIRSLWLWNSKQFDWELNAMHCNNIHCIILKSGQIKSEMFGNCASSFFRKWSRNKYICKWTSDRMVNLWSF